MKIIYLLPILLLASCRTAPPEIAGHGIPNYRQVVPGIACGGQPISPDSWEFVRTNTVPRTWMVLKLNDPITEGVDVVTNIQVCNIVFTPDDLLHGPQDWKVAAALAVVEPDGTFIHCGSWKRTRSSFSRITDTQGGQERTLFIMGMVLVRQYGWSRHDAYRWMRAGNFHPWLAPGLYWYFWHKA